MAMSDHKMNVVQNIMRQQRMEYKRKENLSKPPLGADDVVKTTDFVFSAPFEREGDSGIGRSFAVELERRFLKIESTRRKYSRKTHD